MILLRNAEKNDAEAIAGLTSVPGFLNLRGGIEEILQSIEVSSSAFSGELKSMEESKYIFIAEDTQTNKVLGVSMIAAKHGTLESPHFYFQIEEEEKYSQIIKKGFIHKTIELKYETEGPSEIGSLVIHPEHRNTNEKIGKQISYVRFLYAGLFKDKFQKKIIAELLPPLNKAGKSPLWEAVGRRFTEMDYWEADLMCKQNKEFIFSLFPQEKIYLTFLSKEAQRAVGEVGESTKPAFHMLTKMGFKYLNQIDPFDGGPHLWAELSNLYPIKYLKSYVLDFMEPNLFKNMKLDPLSGLITSVKPPPHHLFEAISVDGLFYEKKKILISEEYEKKINELLGLQKGDQVYFSPYI